MIKPLKVACSKTPLEDSINPYYLHHEDNPGEAEDKTEDVNPTDPKNENVDKEKEHDKPDLVIIMDKRKEKVGETSNKTPPTNQQKKTKSGKVGETSNKTAPTNQRKKTKSSNQPPKKKKGTNASGQGNWTNAKGKATQKDMSNVQTQEPATGKDEKHPKNFVSRSDDVDEIHPLLGDGSGSLSTNDLWA
uniref:Uncharacterized protein n=1 Tax=Cannabis sativa TaxID=3483 RepID=A0A803P7G5_CANSA